MRRQPYYIVLRSRREALGWSQQHLAGLVGTTQSAISDLENGSNPRYGTLRRWTEALGFDVQIVDRSSTRSRERAT